MPLTLRHINADSTWLITLTSPSSSHAPFTILLDPWLDFTASVYHPKFSLQRHSVKPIISSLSELQNPPDIVVISQNKSDHCHEGTCRQLPTSTKVYAVPGADKTVRSWAYFEKKNVVTLKNWKGKPGGRVEKIYIYGNDSASNDSDQVDNHGGNENKVAAILELAYLPALRAWEMPSLHAAIGITYTPIDDKKEQDSSKEGDSSGLPPSPPLTPPDESITLSSPAIATANASILKSISMPSFLPSAKTDLASNGRGKNDDIPSKKTNNTLSLIYSPHGVKSTAIAEYLSSIPRPLTLLLHCFDVVQNPWYLGGNISTGADTMLSMLQGDGKKGTGVKYWISTHDEEKILGGFTSQFVRKRRWANEDVKKEIQKIIGEDEVSVVGEKGTGGLKVLQMGVEEIITLE